MTGQKPKNRRSRGFQRTSNLLQSRVQEVGASRGFAVSRLLTQWVEIVGQDFAAIARPVDVSYGREGLGATLTVLTTGAQALMLDMQKEKLRDKVNACYGFRAISRVKITQTAATGFAEGRVDFAPAPAIKAKNEASPAQKTQTAKTVKAVGNADLRAALEKLGQNILTHQKTEKVHT